jgi:hypothetical protein
MNLSYDPNDPLQHIGEALGLLLVAIAQEHDNPLGLLDATQRAVQKCEEHPEMFAPQTKALVRYASKSLEGAIQAAIDRTQPN